MDLQDNFIVTAKRFNTKKDFIIEISEEITKNVLFSINEYDDAEITNNSKNYDIFVENIDDGEETRLSYGQKYALNDSDHPLPSMEYRIRILNKKTNASKLYLYKIVHTFSTSETQYKTMIFAIGQYDENLLYEQDVKYLSGRRIYRSSYRSFHALITTIFKDSYIINNLLNTIQNNPILKDKKIVVKNSKLKKQSLRSIMKNARSTSSDVNYSSQMIQYSDFALNKYLVYMLRFSQIKLEDLRKKCGEELSKTKGRLSNILNNASINPSKRKKHTNYQIETLEKRIKRLNDFINCSKEILFTIKKMLNSNNFKDVEPSSKRDYSIVYYPQYSSIERHLYLPLFQGFAFSFANDYGSILSSPIKQTSKLFEAYCLLSIDAAITEMGFNNISNDIDYDHIVKRFVKDDFEIELMYEINAKDVSIVNKDEVYFISSGTKHISPDFYLILKRNDIPQCFLVFDSKCRKTSYLYDDIVNGKYNDTIRDYLSLRYSTDNNPFNYPKIVDSLWLLLPEDNAEVDYPPVNKLEYKMIKLEMDGEENAFVSRLEDYLSTYLD